MDKHRKAIIELCAAVELASQNQKAQPAENIVSVSENDWRILANLVSGIKSTFNHSMQFRYEQHLRTVGVIRNGMHPQAEKEYDAA
jgi:hypothetical protein